MSLLLVSVFATTLTYNPIKNNTPDHDQRSSFFSLTFNQQHCLNVFDANKNDYNSVAISLVTAFFEAIRGELAIKN